MRDMNEQRNELMQASWEGTLGRGNRQGSVAEAELEL
jgi:hypothetical protein